jgi:RNA recognition motif-containing protein
MKIYIGNLSDTVSDNDLRTAFEAHGTVESAKLATDRDSGKAKGFGFIEMSNNEEAKAAIAGLDGTTLGGKAVRVNESQPKVQTRSGGGGY